MKRTALVLAFLLASFSVSFSEPVKGEDVEELIRGLKSKSYEAAWSSADKLGKFPQEKERIAPALIEALEYEWDHCTGDIRQGIAYSLAALMAKEGVFPMLDLLKKGAATDHECAECGCCFTAMSAGDIFAERELDPFCWNGVLKAIDQLADFSHSKAIADLILEGKHRPELLITLGKVGPPRYSHFISRYRKDPGGEVRRAVAIALGLNGNPDVSVPVLTHYLSDGKEMFLVRWDASNSLIRIGKTHPPLKRRMIDMLEEKEETTAGLAARVAAHLGSGEGLASLRGRAARGETEAILYLGELGDVGSKEMLIGKLTDGNLTVRTFAMYALGRTGDGSTIPVLKKALADSMQYSASVAEKGERGWSGPGLAKRYGYPGGGEDFLKATCHEAIESIRKRNGASGNGSGKVFRRE